MRPLFPLLALLPLLVHGSELTAQTFQLVYAETPVGSGTAQPIERFAIAGTNGAATRLSDIPASATNDPVGLAFSNEYELFVGNRAGHSGNGSVSRFRFDPTFGGFTPNGTITGNGVTDVAQLAFNPADGELFVTNFNTSIVSRFTFDANGAAVPHGTLTMPDGSQQLGIAFRALDQQLFVSSYGFVRRFRRQLGNYVHVGNFTPPGSAGGMHFMGFRNDELYIADVYANAVFRYRFDANGDPVANGSVSVANAIAVAFSPDRQEMFVARHFSGGFQRLLYQPATGSWTPTTVVTGPQAGGIATTVHFYSTYGTACFGANGEPTLLGYGLPIPGNTVSLRVQRGVPATYGTIVMSLQPGNVAVAGCTWWQTMIVGNTDLFALDGTGRYDLNIRLPGHLVPMDFYFQAFLLDATSPNGLFSTTAGLRASPQ